jgi:hypothetical protein
MPHATVNQTAVPASQSRTLSANLLPDEDGALGGDAAGRCAIGVGRVAAVFAGLAAAFFGAACFVACLAAFLGFVARFAAFLGFVARAGRAAGLLGFFFALVFFAAMVATSMRAVSPTRARTTRWGVECR